VTAISNFSSLSFWRDFDLVKVQAKEKKKKEKKKKNEKMGP